MKTIASLLWLLAAPLFLFAQTNTAKTSSASEIKIGSVLEYDVMVSGNIYPFSLTLFDPKNGGVGFDYVLETSSGKFINTKESLESATRTSWEQPVPGEEKITDKDYTIMMFSKKFFKDIKQNKKANYDNVEWQLKDIPAGSEIKLDGKVVNAIYVTTADGLSKYWILNSEQYPLILKLEGNPLGVDLSVKSIK